MSSATGAPSSSACCLTGVDAEVVAATTSGPEVSLVDELEDSIRRRLRLHTRFLGGVALTHESSLDVDRRRTRELGMGLTTASPSPSAASGTGEDKEGISGDLEVRDAFEGFGEPASASVSELVLELEHDELGASQLS